MNKPIKLGAVDGITVRLCEDDSPDLPKRTFRLEADYSGMASKIGFGVVHARGRAEEMLKAMLAMAKTHQYTGGEELYHPTPLPQTSAYYSSAKKYHWVSATLTHDFEMGDVKNLKTILQPMLGNPSSKDFRRLVQITKAQADMSPHN